MSLKSVRRVEFHSFDREIALELQYEGKSDFSSVIHGHTVLVSRAKVRAPDGRA